MLNIKHIETSTLLFKGLCIATIVVVLAHTIGTVVIDGGISLFGQMLATSNTIDEAVNFVPKVPYIGLNKDRVLKLNIKGNPFGELKNPDGSVRVSKSPNKKPAKLDLELIGTFIGINSADSYAIILDKTSRTQDVFGLEESVFDKASLNKIAPQLVTLLVNGKETNLTLDLDAKSLGSSSAPSGGDETEINLNRSDIQDALDNLPVVLTQARSVPYFTNGKRDGLRLFAIRSGSFFEKIGLKNGDILKGINGSELNDQAKALQLFEKLKTENSISVKLVRNRESKSFRYNIQ